MRVGLYGYLYYEDVEEIFGDDFVEYINRGLYGVCTWLGSVNRDGNFCEGKLLVRMEAEGAHRQLGELFARTEEAFAGAIEPAPSGEGIELAEWLAGKQRDIVRGEDVHFFGKLSLGEEISSRRPRFRVCTECLSGRLHQMQGAECERLSRASVVVEVECSEAFWVSLGQWDGYAEWRPEGGRTLCFPERGWATLLKTFVDRWCSACEFLCCEDGLM
jgi:hypothetical protein